MDDEMRAKYPVRFDILDKFEPVLNQKWKEAAGEALAFVAKQSDENQKRRAETKLVEYEAFRETFKWMCENIFA